jgi:hypothetical protein
VAENDEEESQNEYEKDVFTVDDADEDEEGGRRGSRVGSEQRSDKMSTRRMAS